jgi:hypothetical protein
MRKLARTGISEWSEIWLVFKEKDSVSRDVCRARCISYKTAKEREKVSYHLHMKSLKRTRGRGPCPAILSCTSTILASVFSSSRAVSQKMS